MNVEPIRVATFCGSTQAASVNRQLIAAAQGMAGSRFAFEAYEGLAALPHFNPDLDGGAPLPRWRSCARRSRGPTRS